MRRVNVLTLNGRRGYGCLILIGKFPIRNGQAERQRRNRCSLRVTGHRVRARSSGVGLTAGSSREGERPVPRAPRLLALTAAVVLGLAATIAVVAVGGARTARAA